MKITHVILSVIGCVAAAQALAADTDPLISIQQRWAQCKYQSKNEDEQVSCFKQLIKRNEQAVTAQANRLDLKVWLAINKSSLAGVDGGLGALSLVKEAKGLLELVISQDPKTLDGSAYTSLGSLYYQVPGWPIGFGDDDKAEAMLKKALEINPDGIDPNFFYGDFLAEQGHKKDAVHYFTKALQAQSRPGRELADKGRREEINKRLKELKK